LTVKDLVAGLAPKHGKLIYSSNSKRPRAAVLINPTISFFPLMKFISRDLASATITYQQKIEYKESFSPQPSFGIGNRK
jgi:hypothetical protein